MNICLTTRVKLKWKYIVIENWELKEEFGERTPNISINLSRIDFYDPLLVEKMKNSLLKHGVDCNLVNLEITESAYTKDADQLIAKINEIKGAGLKIEIDDFGSGYSTLNMLTKIPFDVLKIDMVFMKNFSSAGIKPIIKAIVEIAKSLKVQVVCEGVETRNQYEYLKKLKVDYVQGYYLSRPLPFNGFKTILSNELK